MMELRNRVEPYAKAIIHLLKGDVSDKDFIWKDLEEYQIEIQEYLNRIGLELIFNKRDGFAYLRQFEVDDDGNTIGLIQRRQLSFEVSIICVLIREAYEDFEMNPTNIMAEKCFITHHQLKEQAELFFTEGFNQVKFQRDLDKYISKTLELGFLRLHQDAENNAERVYEVKPIIKARISVNELLEFKDKMKQYVESV
ncbi:MAG: DUF4194 domain-containing protein [Saprospiraceae bacterium]|jgi:hypothetical protein|nr:DUF4194 domain-containing protein [Saprospiraceae bacterium]